MRFLEEHLIFNTKSKEFSDDDPPKYLLSYEFRWWYEEYVLKLNIGEAIESDFNRYTRIS